ncbi:hypothetical protein SLS64_007641 [Diaporthe eres]|uniref:Uncharacterized protein n=1 Tax=Diaporthe eres TaxID=83184 RepID=A0ABR1NYN5_DIAER
MKGTKSASLGPALMITFKYLQPAESTVSEHIKLLRQYNKVKDVGQQLIGLNADNRGVPVGSLYSDEHYGVGPKD